MLIFIIAGVAIVGMLSVTGVACYAIYKAGKEQEWRRNRE